MMISHDPAPDGWPQLRIVEHYLQPREFTDKCGKYVPAYLTPIACAEWHFNVGECHTFYPADGFIPAFVRQHENQHCAGHDHPGETSARDALLTFKAKK